MRRCSGDCGWTHAEQERDRLVAGAIPKPFDRWIDVFRREDADDLRDAVEERRERHTAALESIADRVAER